MARVIDFFSRQALVGDAAATPNQNYSEIFEVAEYTTMMIEARVTASTTTGTITTVVIEDAAEPSFRDSYWGTLHTFAGITGVGQAFARVPSAGAPNRYVRAKVLVTAGQVSMVSVRAVARESS